MLMKLPTATRFDGDHMDSPGFAWSPRSVIMAKLTLFVCVDFVHEYIFLKKINEE
jgi:hypothetical protein